MEQRSHESTTANGAYHKKYDHSTLTRNGNGPQTSQPKDTGLTNDTTDGSGHREADYNDVTFSIVGNGAKLQKCTRPQIATREDNRPSERQDACPRIPFHDVSKYQVAKHTQSKNRKAEHSDTKPHIAERDGAIHNAYNDEVNHRNGDVSEAKPRTVTRDDAKARIAASEDMKLRIAKQAGAKFPIVEYETTKPSTAERDDAKRRQAQCVDFNPRNAERGCKHPHDEPQGAKRGSLESQRPKHRDTELEDVKSQTAKLKDTDPQNAKLKGQEPRIVEYKLPKPWKAERDEAILRTTEPGGTRARILERDRHIAGTAKRDNTMSQFADHEGAKPRPSETGSAGPEVARCASANPGRGGSDIARPPVVERDGGLLHSAPRGTKPWATESEDAKLHYSTLTETRLGTTEYPHARLRIADNACEKPGIVELEGTQHRNVDVKRNEDRITEGTKPCIAGREGSKPRKVGRDGNLPRNAELESVGLLIAQRHPATPQTADCAIPGRGKRNATKSPSTENGRTTVEDDGAKGQDAERDETILRSRNVELDGSDPRNVDCQGSRPSTAKCENSKRRGPENMAKLQHIERDDVRPLSGAPHDAKHLHVETEKTKPRIAELEGIKQPNIKAEDTKHKSTELGAVRTSDDCKNTRAELRDHRLLVELDAALRAELPTAQGARRRDSKLESTTLQPTDEAFWDPQNVEARRERKAEKKRARREAMGIVDDPPDPSEKPTLLQNKIIDEHLAAFNDHHDKIAAEDFEREERCRELEFHLKGTVSTEKHREEMRRRLMAAENKYMSAQRQAYKLEHFKILQTLGRGGFGTVYLVTYGNEEREMALKQMPRKNISGKNDVRHLFTEANCLATLYASPYFPLLYACFSDGENVYMLMEYLQGGDLISLLRQVRRFDEEVTAFYMAELIQAVSFVHQSGYIHRDIKPDNTCFTIEGHLKLLDFGLAKEDRGMLEPGRADEQRLMKTHVGTPFYMAPETIARTGYSASIDVWAIGCVTWDCLIGRSPFVPREVKSDEAQNSFLKKVFAQIISFDSVLPKLYDVYAEKGYLSETSQRLFRGVFANAKLRMTLHEMREHPFFRNIDFNSLLSMQPPYAPSRTGKNALTRTHKLKKAPGKPTKFNACEQELGTGGLDLHHFKYCKAESPSVLRCMKTSDNMPEKSGKA